MTCEAVIVQVAPLRFESWFVWLHLYSAHLSLFVHNLHA
jgi:hypothetical protein